MGGGVRVDVNEEFKFLRNSKKKKFEGGGVRGAGGGGVRLVEGGGGGGQGGYERRIKVFVKIQKKNF